MSATRYRVKALAPDAGMADSEKAILCLIELDGLTADDPDREVYATAAITFGLLAVEKALHQFAAHVGPE